MGLHNSRGRPTKQKQVYIRNIERGFYQRGISITFTSQETGFVLTNGGNTVPRLTTLSLNPHHNHYF